MLKKEQNKLIPFEVDLDEKQTVLYLHGKEHQKPPQVEEGKLGSALLLVLQDVARYMRSALHPSQFKLFPTFVCFLDIKTLCYHV